MFNMLITRPFTLFIPQLIVDVEWTNKMRQQYNIEVKEWDIVPGEYLTMSTPKTTTVWDETSVDVDEGWKIIYEMQEIACNGKCRKTLRKVNITLPEFEYIDL